MKITHIGSVLLQPTRWVLVKVETDEGITGIGEAYHGAGVHQIVVDERLTRPLIGQDPRNVDKLFRDMMRAMSASGFYQGAVMSAISGIETALWDITGKAVGIPIWQLLGGRVRDRIPVTQCTGYKTPEHTAEDAQWGWERGFRAYKMKCITGAETTPESRIEYVTDRIEAIHRVLPHMVVRPDIRWRLGEVWVAQELAHRLRGHKIDSLESPIDRRKTSNYAEWRRLRQTIHLPIGDHVPGADNLLTVFKEQAVDYVIVGGESYLDTVHQSRLAHDLGLGGWSQTVSYGPGVAMSLHVAACMPHLTQPYDMVGPMAWEDMLVNEDFPFEDGSFLAPDRPGLGYTLNHDAVAHYLVSKRVYE